MIDGGVGLLRMLAPPDDRALARLWRSATALGAEWLPTGGYPAFVRSLDPTSATGAALLVQAARARNGRDCEPGDEVEVVLRAADPLTRRVDLDVV
jgi:hypothetical protein